MCWRGSGGTQVKSRLGFRCFPTLAWLGRGWGPVSTCLSGCSGSFCPAGIPPPRVHPVRSPGLRRLPAGGPALAQEGGKSQSGADQRTGETACPGPQGWGGAPGRPQGESGSVQHCLLSPSSDLSLPGKPQRNKPNFSVDIHQWFLGGSGEKRILAWGLDLPIWKMGREIPRPRLGTSGEPARLGCVPECPPGHHVEEGSMGSMGQLPHLWALAESLTFSVPWL